MPILRVHLSPRSWVGLSAVVFAATLGAALLAPPSSAAPKPRTGDGQAIFRFDTFGDEQLWTDQLRMHEVIESSISPAAALGLGLKVDVDALPASLQQAIQQGQVNLNDPAVTVALLKLNAVVGLIGKVETIG